MKTVHKINAAELHQNVPPDWYFTSMKVNLLQRFWHLRRFKAVSELAEKTSGKILDIGSADGVFTSEIAKYTGAKKVIGVDVLKSSVNWANIHWRKNKKLKFKVADAHRLPFKNSEFDAVFALEVLEHIDNPQKVLSEIKRVLKKGGYAVFLVPTDSWIFKTLWDLVWTKTRGRVWNDTHIQSYKNDKLVKLSTKAGFKLKANKRFINGMLQVIKLKND